jgi:hypothetical protein
MRLKQMATVVATLVSVGCISPREAEDDEASLSNASTSPSATSNRVQLTLPSPTGSHEVGTVSLHLIDRNRQDPFFSTPHAREIMVSVWYPADLRWWPEGDCGSAGKTDKKHWSCAPWMTPGALAVYRANLERDMEMAPPPRTSPDGGNRPDGGNLSPSGDGGMLTPDGGIPPLDISLDNVDFPITHARLGAPAKYSKRPYPVVLYSPSGLEGREVGTALVEDLASRGYVVVTLSHTYESREVEFRGGRVELGQGVDDPFNITHPINGHPHLTEGIRVADTRFVIDKLTQLVAGMNPDAEGRPLPRGLRQALDMTKVGMFGHSLGGGTTSQAFAADSRIDAAINLDGSIFPLSGTLRPLEAVNAELAAAAQQVGARPYMVMTSSGKSPAQTGALLNGFYSALTGYRRLVAVTRSTHGDYTDIRTMIGQLADAGVIPQSLVIGELEPERAITIERIYISAFFDLWLKNQDNHLLDTVGPSAEHPEVTVYH